MDRVGFALEHIAEAKCWLGRSARFLTCGTRACSCGEETCARASGKLGQNFGIHSLNTSARPQEPMSTTDVEAHFTTKSQTAFQSQKVRWFLGFWHGLLRRELEYVHFGLRDGCNPSPPLELGRRSWPRGVLGACAGGHDRPR